MTSKSVRKALGAAAIVAGCLSLGGCLGPTYGTGKSQGETLFDDLNNFVALGNTDQAQIAYNPRPPLVKPQNTKVLPPPQASRTTANDPNFPESPEARSKRLQASAQQGDGILPADVASARKEGVTQEYLDRTSGGGYTFKNDHSAGFLTQAELESHKDEVAKRLRDQKQGSPTQRKYLSEPPVAYRTPAATAPIGVQGEDEETKARRLKNGGKQGFFDKLGNLLPSL
ncbi:hypothetical protein [Jiella sp. M17.18]|uniref:hypothetical protein n=1 Tax=Jiella sp. M17.18 TaxID=3234247 RepID=UPI0034DFF7C6